MILSWFLYKMVAHFTMLTCDEKWVFSEKKNQIWLPFQCNQRPSTNRNSCFTPYVRIVKWATILYKNHGFYVVANLLVKVYFWNCSRPSINRNIRGQFVFIRVRTKMLMVSLRSVCILEFLNPLVPNRHFSPQRLLYQCNYHLWPYSWYLY